MSKAVSPRLHHRILRRVGMGLHRAKGVNWMLRRVHYHDSRQHWILQFEAQALCGGPKFLLETRSFTEWQTYFYGTQDRAIHRWVRDHVRPDWICFDVGMNFGFFACLFAQRCKEVHGFE